MSDEVEKFLGELEEHVTAFCEKDGYQYFVGSDFSGDVPNIAFYINREKNSKIPENMILSENKFGQFFDILEFNLEKRRKQRKPEDLNDPNQAPDADVNRNRVRKTVRLTDEENEKADRLGMHFGSASDPIDFNTLVRTLINNMPEP